jgi:hypothetical protein
MNLSVTNLSLFETSKSERQNFAEQITNNLLEGLADPLKVHLQVKCMEDLIKQITSNSVYKDLLVTEAAKFGKSFEHHNAKFEIKETGVKYDYESCSDPILKDLEDELALLESKIKDRQSFLKSIKGTIEILIGDELVTLYPPVKTSTTSVTINLK